MIMNYRPYHEPEVASCMTRIPAKTDISQVKNVPRYACLYVLGILGVIFLGRGSFYVGRFSKIGEKFMWAVLKCA